MKLIEIVKKSIKPSLVIIGINYGALFACTSLGGCTTGIISGINLDEKKIEAYHNLPADFNTLDYLNLANSLVHNKTEDKGVCRDYTHTTFDIYHKLIELNGREDLKEKIRMALGTNRINNGQHMLLEFEDEKLGKFVPYETEDKIKLLSPNEVKTYSKDTKKEKTKGLNETWVRSTVNGVFFYPTADLIKYYPAGLAGLVYKNAGAAYKNISKSF